MCESIACVTEPAIVQSARPMTRAERLKDTAILFVVLAAAAAVKGPTVATLVGTGAPGFSDTHVNNPYGMAIGPDGGLYFCDLDNQRIRRLDLKTKRLMTIAGSGQRGYQGDGGLAKDASLNMPHELRFDTMGDLYIAERDN